MSGRDALGTVTVVGGGILGGLAIGPVAAAVLGLIGAAVALAVIRAGIRWVVALPVLLGTAAGAVLGWAITHAFCRPEGCPVIEATAASVTGIGSLVGVGLVVALAVRSFDEYRHTPSNRGDGTDQPAPPS